MASLEDELKTMEVDLARAILNEAKSSGFMEEPIPESDAEIVAEAMYWYEEAVKAYDTGMRHDTIQAILQLMDYGTREDVGGGSEYNPGYASGVPPKSSGGYSESDLREEPSSEYKPTGVVGPSGASTPLEIKHNLPIPKDYDDDPEDMPRDISELGDKDIRRLHGIYNAYMARAKYLLAIETNDLSGATHLRDHSYRIGLKNTVKIDPKTEKAKLKEVLDAEVRETEEFKKWDAKVRGHQDDVTALKALVDIYSGHVSVLSREWTFRHNEWEKSR